VVAENGAVLYTPHSKEARNLAEAPPPRFAERLRTLGVTPLSIGRVIVATRQPNEGTVLDTIRQLGLDLQITFNKGAVMVLPGGVNKESGLCVALDDLGLVPRNCVAVGDAENDFTFLNICGTSVAVANALESVKERVTFVTRAASGAGVAELIDQMVADDLAAVDATDPRQRVLLAEGVEIAPHRERVLLAGASGGGKSTFTLGWLERLAAAGFQYCVIDPEGDYEGLEHALEIGEVKDVPDPEAVTEILRKSPMSVAVNMLGVETKDRPTYYSQLLPALKSLRAQTGRPHVVIVDEAHHVLPAEGAGERTSGVERGMMFATVDLHSLAACVVEAVESIDRLRRCCRRGHRSVLRCTWLGTAAHDTGCREKARCFYLPPEIQRHADSP
jgi:hydroxymethylpyrimidine pyrophosphatase-like HAD family hydrolase